MHNVFLDIRKNRVIMAKNQVVDAMSITREYVATVLGRVSVSIADIVYFSAALH